jgi:hypothetical protein
MFYTFIVLFEKSSTLIDLMDLCKDFIRKEESDKPSLNGLGVLHGGDQGWPWPTPKSSKKKKKKELKKKII